MEELEELLAAHSRQLKLLFPAAWVSAWGSAFVTLHAQMLFALVIVGGEAAATAGTAVLEVGDALASALTASG
jgi:hypothetical protein